MPVVSSSFPFFEKAGLYTIIGMASKQTSRFRGGLNRVSSSWLPQIIRKEFPHRICIFTGGGVLLSAMMRCRFCGAKNSGIETVPTIVPRKRLVSA